MFERTTESESGGVSTGAVDFLLKGWRYLLVGILSGALLALVYVGKAPVRYEAEAWLTTAKVMGAEVASALQISNALKIPTFYDINDLEVCGLKSSNPDIDQIFLSQAIRTKVEKGGDILKLTYVTNSKELAFHCLDFVTKKVINSQNDLTDSFVGIAKSEFESINNRLRQISNVDPFADQLNAKSNKNSSFKDPSLLLYDYYASSEVYDLRKSLLLHAAAISPPQTRPAQLLAPVLVKRVNISMLYFMIVGVFAGALVGLFVFLISQRLKI